MSVLNTLKENPLDVDLSMHGYETNETGYLVSSLRKLLQALQDKAQQQVWEAWGTCIAHCVQIPCAAIM